MNKTAQTLNIEIETAIQLIVAATRRAVLAAVDEAFGSASTLRPHTGTAAGSRTNGHSGTGHPKKSSPRRSSDEIAELAERFYTAVCDAPGKLMAELAAKMDVAPSTLLVPVAQLKRAGRIRAVGQRQNTRYFPRLSKDGISAVAQDAA